MFKVDDPVFSEKHGLGVVVEVDPDRGAYPVEVRFSDYFGDLPLVLFFTKEGLYWDDDSAPECNIRPVSVLPSGY